MSRKIKFRVWSKDDNKLWYCDYLQFGIGGIRFHDLENDRQVVVELTDGSYELEQFSGILDSKKNEIYEGDIVSIDFDTDEVEKSEVKFSSGGFIVEADFGDYDLTTIGWAIEMAEEIKVIGNIHQNPELLKQNNMDTNRIIKIEELEIGDEIIVPSKREKP